MKLADLRRRAVEREIEDAALRLFLARGFDATTVDDVAAEIGASRSTVFRYFPTKEDLLLASMRETGERLATEVTAAPPTVDASGAINAVMLGFAAEFDAGGAAAKRRARLLADTPSLEAGMSVKHRTWQDLLGDAVLERVDGPQQTRRLRAVALVASRLACLNVAITEWARSDTGGTAEELVATAFEAV
jgi:AcrR family transcriptional regulator